MRGPDDNIVLRTVVRPQQGICAMSRGQRALMVPELTAMALDESLMGRPRNIADILDGRVWQRANVQLAVRLADVDTIEHQAMEVHP